MGFLGHAVRFTAAGTLAIGCDTTFTCEELRTCVEAPPSGVEAGTGGQPIPVEAGVDAPAEGAPPDPPVVVDANDAPSCDESETPDVEGCLLDDKYAVFVAAGSSDGDGSKASPVATIAEGLAAAAARRLSRVIVCNATYPETVSLEASSGGIGVFGGFTCPGDAGGWTRTETERPLIRPAAGIALTVTGVAERVTIQDVDFAAADAAAPGASSIAAIIATSTLSLRRVALDAGSGAAGSTGDSGASGKAGAAPGTPQNGRAPVCDGAIASISGGTSAVASECGSAGGRGGGAVLNGSGESGGKGLPGASENGGTPALVAGASFPGGAGKVGAIGAVGKAGAVAPERGTFSQNGFNPASGWEGTDGESGQGGGGGGASKGAYPCTGASGGAGGQGGCGGKRGKGGGGGGASVALLSWDSDVLLLGARLTSKNGGKGGDGGFSGAGGAGANGGSAGPASSNVGPSGAGGRGGPGGNGGAGSGGTGGPSYALVVHGTPVTQRGDTTLTPGDGGDKGLGGAVTGMPTIGVAPSGAVGLSAPMYPQD